MLPSKTEVLIVGAGPTGTALAIQLQQAGVPHLVIDKLTAGQNTSRAAVIHAHTLEQLERIGVTKELVARGIKVPDFTIRDRNKSLLTIEFAHLPSAHPYLLMLPQDVTEAVLVDRFHALGGTIHRGVSATSFDMRMDKVLVKVSAEGREQEIEARYVVGADGMHSAVRKAAGIDFQGAAYGESFILADVEMDWALGKSEVSLFFSPEGLVVVAPLPNGGFRIVATLENAPEAPTLADVQALLDRRGPTDSINTVKSVTWSSRFRVHHRLAEHYRRGRMFLMGDSAHVHSPAGGQGMNAGLVDSMVLGQILGDVVRGRKQESALEGYETLRRPAAAEVLALAGRLTQMATVQGRGKRFVRNLLLSVVNRLPPAKRRIMMNLSGLARENFARVEGAQPIAAAPAVDAYVKRAA